MEASYVHKLSKSTFWIRSYAANTFKLFFPSCLLTTNIYKNRYFFSLVGKDSLANAEKNPWLLDATAEEFKAGNKKIRL